MSTIVKQVPRKDVERFIRIANLPDLHVEIFMKCIQTTTQYWMGWVDGEVVCVYGVIPPSLASDTAYLWLYTTPALDGNEFVFVRHSQRAVQELLKIYPRIVGHATVGAHRSLRWLKWLGAAFNEPKGDLIPFNIRAKHG